LDLIACTIRQKDRSVRTDEGYIVFGRIILELGKCKLGYVMEYTAPTRSERTFVVGQFDSGGGG